MSPQTYPILLVALVAFALGSVAGSMWIIWRVHRLDQRYYQQSCSRDEETK